MCTGNIHLRLTRNFMDDWAYQIKGTCTVGGMYLINKLHSKLFLSLMRWLKHDFWQPAAADSYVVCTIHSTQRHPAQMFTSQLDPTVAFCELWSSPREPYSHQQTSPNPKKSDWQSTTNQTTHASTNASVNEERTCEGLHAESLAFSNSVSLEMLNQHRSSQLQHHLKANSGVLDQHHMTSLRMALLTTPRCGDWCSSRHPAHMERSFKLTNCQLKPTGLIWLIPTQRTAAQFKSAEAMVDSTG